MNLLRFHASMLLGGPRERRRFYRRYDDGRDLPHRSGARHDGEQTMNRTTTLTTTLLSAVLAGTLVLTGCAKEEDDASATIQQASNPSVIEYTVEGMHCDGCAAGLQEDIAAIAGVTSCEVDFDSSSATVHVDNAAVAEEVVKTVKDMEYTIVVKAEHAADVSVDGAGHDEDSDAHDHDEGDHDEEDHDHEHDGDAEGDHEHS